MIRFLTDLADQDVIIPLEIVVFLGFALLRRWRLALAWGLVTCGGSALILLLKLGFEACGSTGSRILYSPSGHTMAGTTVYGGLLAVLRVRRAILMGATVAIACLLGWSRVMLGSHTVPEVMLGGAVGVGLVGLFYHLAGPPPATLRPMVGLFGVAVCIVALFHGQHSLIEAEIQEFSHLKVGPLLCRPAADSGAS